MLTGEDGRTRLIDFSVSQLLPAAPAAAAAIDGAASAAGASLAGSARTPGTPAFTAPECCSGGSFDGAAADVWALGISLYTMLTGAPPFMGNTLVETYQRIQSEELPQPPGLEADTPVGHLLARMLDKDPGKRATISEVLEDAWVKQHACIAQIAPE
jgi:serine/threonine protein kinase